MVWKSRGWMGARVDNTSERGKKPSFGKRGQVAKRKRKPSVLERLRNAVTSRWRGKKVVGKAKQPQGKGIQRSRLGT